MVNNELQIPPMRETLIHYLNKLSDLELQRTAWAKDPGAGVPRHDNLDFPLIFLYEDTDLATNSENWIGVILKNESEMRAVDEVIAAIDAFFEKYNTDMADEEYIKKPEWQGVVDAAKSAYELIRERNPSATLPTEDESKS